MAPAATAKPIRCFSLIDLKEAANYGGLFFMFYILAGSVAAFRGRLPLFTAAHLLFCRMGPAERQPRRYTPAEYFAMEEQSEVRHEYYDGEIFAMAGGTKSHNLITQNVTLSAFRRHNMNGDGNKLRQPQCCYFTARCCISA